MKAIITVVGKDKAGIVAGVSAKIAEFGLNIDDISQTVFSLFLYRTVQLWRWLCHALVYRAGGCRQTGMDHRS